MRREEIQREGRGKKRRKKRGREKEVNYTFKSR